jgi:glycerol uptake operon antiterminator
VSIEDVPGGGFLNIGTLLSCLECNPVIAAVTDEKWKQALESPAQVIFYLSANLLSVEEKVRQAHEAEKYVMVHLDLAEGIGRDRSGIRFLAQCGVDGIISTRAQLIRLAKEQNLITVQRFFALDSKGMESIEEMLRATNPHLMEIMPGVIGKAIRRFRKSGIAVIAGGLIETKQEVTDALGAGATAVSTGQQTLWYL